MGIFRPKNLTRRTTEGAGAASMQQNPSDHEAQPHTHRPNGRGTRWQTCDERDAPPGRAAHQPDRHRPGRQDSELSCCWSRSLRPTGLSRRLRAPGHRCQRSVGFIGTGCPYHHLRGPLKALHDAQAGGQGSNAIFLAKQGKPPDILVLGQRRGGPGPEEERLQVHAPGLNFGSGAA